jgi:hypothetical protein
VDDGSERSPLACAAHAHDFLEEVHGHQRTVPRERCQFARVWTMEVRRGKLQAGQVPKDKQFRRLQHIAVRCVLRLSRRVLPEVPHESDRFPPAR